MCKQLGHDGVSAVWEEAYGERDLPGLMANLTCNGTEAFLDQCDFALRQQAATLSEFT